MHFSVLRKECLETTRCGQMSKREKMTDRRWTLRKRQKKKKEEEEEEKSRQGRDDHPGESRIMDNKKIESMGRGVKCCKNISENYN